jgi:hypothetical protein
MASGVDEELAPLRNRTSSMDQNMRQREGKKMAQVRGCGVLHCTVIWRGMPAAVQSPARELDGLAASMRGEKEGI